jgi:hypothetical protein
MTTPEQNQKIISYLMPYKPTKIGIFGSYARGENRLDSDIDILIDWKARVPLWTFASIVGDLSELLGTKVDLITTGAIHPLIEQEIKKELQLIYEHL